MKIEIYVKGYKEEKENAFHFAFLHKKRRNTEKTTDFRIWKFLDFLSILEGYVVAGWLLILLAITTYLPS